MKRYALSLSVPLIAACVPCAAQVSLSRIVNGASYGGSELAAGAVVTLFGSNLGPAELVAATAPAGLVETSLAQTRVLFDGIAAPVLYTSRNQVSAVVPWRIASQQAAEVSVEYEGVVSNSLRMPVAETAPGVFTANSSGQGVAAAVNEDGTPNSAANPAPRGSVVAIYATGCGILRPLTEDGLIATLPLPVLAARLSVRIGGEDAEILYAGATAGMVTGLLEIRFRVPASVPSGPAVPLILQVGTVESQSGVTLAVGAVAEYSRVRGRVRIANQTVVADNGELLRGGHLGLPKNFAEMVAFGRDPANWVRIRDEYNLNALRILCYRLPIPNWSGVPFEIDEMLPHLDQLVQNAADAGMYIVIAYTSVGGYVYDDVKSFWTKVAPRYKDRTNVIYEVANEPFTWYPDFYTWDNRALVSMERDMYRLIRQVAPDTHVILWSVSNLASTAKNGLLQLVKQAPEISYANASVGFHPYQWDGGARGELTALRAEFPVVCTEFESEIFFSSPPATIADMESLGISWVFLGDKMFWAGNGHPVPWPKVTWPRDPALDGTPNTVITGAVSTNGLQMWLRADTGVALENGAVLRWEDQSGRGSHATVDNAQPVLISASANGKPSLRFDGASQSLRFPVSLEGLSAATLVVVASNTANRDGGASRSESAALFWDETDNWGTSYVSPFQSTVQFRFGTTQTMNWPTHTRPAPIGSALSITVCRKDGGTDSLYVNGALAASEGGKLETIRGSKAPGYLGRGLNNTYFPGDIAEVLIYTRALTDMERRNVEKYLTDKYLR